MAVVVAGKLKSRSPTATPLACGMKRIRLTVVWSSRSERHLAR
jgi:hypothetical protein